METFSFFNNITDNNISIEDWVADMQADNDKNIWIATDDEGLNLFDIKQKTFKRIGKDIGQNLYSDKILSLFLDNNQLYKDSLIETISYVDSLTKRPEISDTTKKIDNISTERKLELLRGMVR